MSTRTSGLEVFVSAYIACTIWLLTDSEGNSLDYLDRDNLAPEALASLTVDCESFYRDNAELWQSAGMDDSDAGHNFYLTRNGHGTGFWDRGLGEVGEKLSKASHTYGEDYFYWDDDDTTIRRDNC